MRSTFQMLVFIAYMAALGAGGWYVFSGRMVADQEAAQAPIRDEPATTQPPSEEIILPDETVTEPEEASPPSEETDLAPEETLIPSEE